MNRDIDNEAQGVAADLAARQNTGRGNVPGAAAQPVEVRIDWSGLARRARRIAVPGTAIGGLTPAPEGHAVAVTVFTAGAGGGSVAWQGLAVTGAPPERMARLAKATRGFLYVISSFGVTGARGELGAREADLQRGARFDLHLVDAALCQQPQHRIQVEPARMHRHMHVLRIDRPRTHDTFDLRDHHPAVVAHDLGAIRLVGDGQSHSHFGQAQ